MRERVSERNWFGFDEKREMLVKSDNRCCHCGCTLNERTSTVEHFIPLSKGGNNDMVNLVCLCKDCNDKKSDLIVRPYQYYRYLKDEYINELDGLFNDYNKDISWLTAKNFTKEDILEFRYSVVIPSLQGHNAKKRGSLYCTTGLYVTATLKKATYEDLDSIYEFAQKYHKKYGLPTDYIKEAITDVFTRGALYMLLKKDELTALFPVKAEYININGTTGLCMNFTGLLCLYQTKDNMELIADVIYYMTGYITSVNPDRVNVLCIAIPSSDTEMCEMIGNESIYHSESDGWSNYVISIEDTKEEGVCAVFDDKDFKDRFKRSSKFLKQMMNI